MMCGRFSLSTTKEKIQAELPFVEVDQNLRISYNIAPTQHAYVVANDQPTRLQYIVWGLIPYWSRDGKVSGKLINARMEGIETKPSFRMPIRQRRCLVLADSFYEWKREGSQKVPYRIFAKDGRLLTFGGIWDLWYDGEYGLKTFAIITTPPSEEMAPVHNRMPLLLSTPEERELWLAEGAELNDILSLLRPAEDGTLAMYRISKKVNSVKNDGPELHEEVPDQPGLFQ